MTDPHPHLKAPIKVLVTGAAGQIGYSLLYIVASGKVFGDDQPLILVMLDIPSMMPCLEGVAMELRDAALTGLVEVVATDKEEVAFKNIDAAFLVGAMPRREGMERKDLLAANVKIFKSQGNALDKFAKKTVKVLVVGNPANTNALICSKYAPSIPKENFTAMTRLDHNRAMYQIAAKVGQPICTVRNVTIWGNHSSTQFPDASNAEIFKDGKFVPAVGIIADDAWLKGDFIKTVQQRGGAIIKARKLSSAMSAASSSGDHMRNWFYGTAENEWTSMAVSSNGNPYGVSDGLIYSFPVFIDKTGKWSIVKGLKLNDFQTEKMKVTADELIAERDDALDVCK